MAQCQWWHLQSTKRLLFCLGLPSPNRPAPSRITCSGQHSNHSDLHDRTSARSAERATHLLGNIVVGLIMWGLALGQHTLLGIDGLRGPRATHFSGYCCWFMWGLGQHNLLDIVVGLYGTLGSTLYWVLLGYARFQTTQFTGHHWLLVGHFWYGPSAIGIKYYFKKWKSKCRFPYISSETAEANNILTNKITWHYFLFPNNLIT
jgi:hypothetical protein